MLLYSVNFIIVSVEVAVAIAMFIASWSRLHYKVQFINRTPLQVDGRLYIYNFVKVVCLEERNCNRPISRHENSEELFSPGNSVPA